MKELLSKSGLLLAVLAIGTYGIVALRGPNGLAALADKRTEIQRLQDTNATLATENARKRERIDLLQHDRATQELEIRQKLKLMKPGETQFIVPDSRSPAPAVPDPSRTK
ncbi:MAG: septum formation initiator family protein [Bryobacteraceae bacterium]|nr:septum formation initiator family protein [Bryobacteraceae bacterium]